MLSCPLPSQMSFCHTASLLPSLFWQQKEHWWDCCTPTSASEATGQHENQESSLLELPARIIFYVYRVMKRMNRLPREAMELPSLEILQSHLDMVPGSPEGASAWAVARPDGFPNSTILCWQGFLITESKKTQTFCLWGEMSIRSQLFWFLREHRSSII